MKENIPIALLVTLVGALLAAPGSAAHVGIWDASFQLDPGQEVPPPNRGEGFGQCVSSLQGAELTLSCTHNLVDAIAAHIHLGAPGVAGPVILPLGDGASPIQAQLELTPEEVADYLIGSYYVNVHTGANPEGEIRGQVVPRPQPDATDLRFGGDAGQETEEVDSEAVARCRAILTDRSGESQLRVLCSHTVADPIAAHIHQAPPGVPGPVIFPFDDPASPLDQTFTLAPSQVRDLFAGNLYVNVHTDEYPAGEVRANLVGCFETPNQMCLQQNRFSVTVTGSRPVPESATPQGFVGRAIERTDSAGEFYFFSPDNLELLVKVLDGCAINDRYWVFFAATTDVEFNLLVIDSSTGESMSYNNPQGSPADAVTDTDAFDACPDEEPEPQ
ncbi:MAG TPA: CHRD domain-containing protein [Thermoanaerobaculia bacterium]|nr:CHRD domain-containing protein [Thermoanaerobaculia bacterium]